jgi:hypothetical protein
MELGDPTMESETDFQQVFTQLKAILKKFERHLVVKTDSEHAYYLDSKLVGKNKKPISFGAAMVMKNYVSFHLMPIYSCTESQIDISPELKARMQGKACFNFTKADAKLFKELARLTKDGFERFQSAGYI